MEEKVLDVNWTELIAGDSISIIQNLKVKWSKDIKQGTVVKNIRLVAHDNAAIEGRVDGTVMVLKTCYVKKITKK